MFPFLIGLILGYVGAAMYRDDINTFLTYLSTTIKSAFTKK